MRAGSTPSGTRLLLKKEATPGQYRNRGYTHISAPRKTLWARGAVGSARESHSRGQGFESPRVHHSIRFSNTATRKPKDPVDLAPALAPELREQGLKKSLSLLSAACDR